MKIAIKLIVFAFALSVYPAKAFNLLDTNNTWSVLVHDELFYDPIHFPELPPVGIEADLSTWYKVGEDSVFEGKTYKKIMKSRDVHQEQWAFDRLMREEGDKVYTVELIRMNQLVQVEYLLYDFGMNVGDTIIKPGYNEDYDFSIATVLESVRDTVIAGVSRKMYSIYNFSVREPEYKVFEIWIEGIGSLLGLFRESCNFVVGCYSDYSLLCFSYNDELLYRDPIYNECYSNKIGPVSIHSPNMTLDVVVNSSTNTFSISGLEQTAEVILCDLNGRILLRRNRENNEDIDISSLAAGMYLIQIKTGNQMIVRKLLKK